MVRCPPASQWVRFTAPFDWSPPGRQAVTLAHRVLKAVWEQGYDCADREVLAALIVECGLKPSLIAEADRDEWARQRREDSEAALARGVFGAPSYVIEDEIFWGQDRLDFVDRHLAAQ